MNESTGGGPELRQVISTPKDIEYQIDLLEEESRQRLKEDHKEFSYIQIYNLIILILGTSLVRWIATSPLTKSIQVLPGLLFIVLFISFPGYVIISLPKIWLFSDSHRTEKEKDIEENVQEIMNEREGKNKKPPKHVAALREARALRVKRGRI